MSEPAMPDSTNDQLVAKSQLQYENNQPLLLLLDCSICVKKFPSARSFDKHMKTEHNETHPFSCNVCHKPFTNCSNLKAHHDGMHQGIKKNTSVHSAAGQYRRKKAWPTTFVSSTMVIGHVSFSAANALPHSPILTI